MDIAYRISKLSPEFRVAVCYLLLSLCLGPTHLWDSQCHAYCGRQAEHRLLRDEPLSELHIIFKLREMLHLNFNLQQKDGTWQPKAPKLSAVSPAYPQCPTVSQPNAAACPQGFLLIIWADWNARQTNIYK